MVQIVRLYKSWLVNSKLHKFSGFVTYSVDAPLVFWKFSLLHLIENAIIYKIAQTAPFYHVWFTNESPKQFYGFLHISVDAP